MADFRKVTNSRAALAAGAAVLVALGAAGGAGAVQATRPTVEMAPTLRTPIGRLAQTSGVVTVEGRVAEVYGDRFVVQDGSGRTLVAAGREARGTVSAGQPVMVQGRYDDGQLRASYLVDKDGRIVAAGPAGPRPDGPGYPGGPKDRPGRDGPPPPPPGCGPVPPAGPGGMAPPPPPPSGARPASEEESAAPPPSGANPGPTAAPAPAPAAQRR